MKQNCLSRALDQWNEDKSMRLWYNSNHVVAVKENYFMIKRYEGMITYHSLEKYGLQHFIESFELDKKHTNILAKYFISLK